MDSRHRDATQRTKRGKGRWQKVDRRTIIIETRLERSEGTSRGKEIQEFQINETIRPIGGTKDQIVQNDVEYSGDAKLLISKDTHEQLCERIGNYDISAETRELEIQSIKVEILRRGENKLTRPLPAPFGQIKQKSTGTILRKEISTNGSLAKAVEARISEAQNTWRIAN